MTPSKVRAYLDSFINYELKSDTAYIASLKLDRVDRLLELIGNPQKKIRIIHVAGTKGKGSTCAFTATILQSADYSVGLYTSPHLIEDKERIRVLDQKKNGRDHDPFAGKISEKDFCRHLEKIKPAIEEVKNDPRFGCVSFFEIYTAVAFSYFEKMGVDFAILETGLGGRLDATNVAESLVCAITPIGIEHTRQLGTTLKKIASEKAAIIKSGNRIVVIAPQRPEAVEVIKNRCRKMKTRAVWIGKDIKTQAVSEGVSKQTFHLRTGKRSYRNLETVLLGRHQMDNAAVAVGIIEELEKKNFTIGAQAIREGIKKTRWPGRFEVIRKNPFVVLDGAHNPDAMRILTQAVRHIFPKKKLTLILGVSKDKDIGGICRELKVMAARTILTKAHHPRALDFKTVDTPLLFDGRPVIFTENVSAALKEAFRGAKKGDVIVVTGSLFIVGEARVICTKRN